MHLLPEHLPVLHCSAKSKAVCTHWGTQAYAFAVLWCKNSTCIHVFFCSESHPSLFWQCHKSNCHFFRPVRINITECLAHSKIQDSPQKKRHPLHSYLLTVFQPEKLHQTFKNIPTENKAWSFPLWNFWTSQNKRTSCFAYITTLVPNTRGRMGLQWIIVKYEFYWLNWSCYTKKYFHITEV